MPWRSRQYIPVAWYSSSSWLSCRPYNDGVELFRVGDVLVPHLDQALYLGAVLRGLDVPLLDLSAIVGTFSSGQGLPLYPYAQLPAGCWFQLRVLLPWDPLWAGDLVDFLSMSLFLGSGGSLVLPFVGISFHLGLKKYCVIDV